MPEPSCRTAANGSSPTSSTTSTRSSTSDAAAGALRRFAGLVRLTHPFPILLDAAATAVIATIAGAGLPAAARLGVAMLALQASIGALNDLVDAPRDAVAKPAKPIPAGLVSPGVAGVVVAGGAALGLALSLPGGLPVAATAGLVLAVGYAYDLRLKGTAWSWLPFALGIPMLPVYAWLGASGTLPAAFGYLLPAAVLAGAALAVANALADADRDRAAGVPSVALALGPPSAWRLHASLHLGVAALAVIGLAALSPGPMAWPLAGGVASGLVAGPLLVVVGLALTIEADAHRRERGWELEAIGTAVLGAAWLAAVAIRI